MVEMPILLANLYRVNSELPTWYTLTYGVEINPLKGILNLS